MQFHLHDKAYIVPSVVPNLPHELVHHKLIKSILFFQFVNEIVQICVAVQRNNIESFISSLKLLYILIEKTEFKNS